MVIIIILPNYRKKFEIYSIQMICEITGPHTKIVIYLNIYSTTSLFTWLKVVLNPTQQIQQTNKLRE